MSTQYPTTKQNRWLLIDELGAFVGLRRETGEQVKDFRDKIRDTFVHRAGASYDGLINSIGRELGLERKLAFTITCSNKSYRWGVIKNASKLILFSRLENISTVTGSIEKTIDLQPYDAFPTIQDIIDDINTTDYFTATVQDTSILSEPAMYLINGTSYKIGRDQIQPTKVFKLSYQNLHPNSLYFSRNSAFITEVANTVFGPQSTGEYSVDYKKGIVYTYTYPTTEIQFTYSYTEDPFYMYHVPVSITSLIDPLCGDLLFQQMEELVYTNDNDSTSSFVPRPELIDLIHELKRVSNIYWGA